MTHKRQNSVALARAASFGLMALCLVFPAHAQEGTAFSSEMTAPSPAAAINPYVATGVDVDVSADNAVAAREKAFQAALVKGFGKMADQMVTDEAQRQRLRALSAPEIGRMLQDFSVTGEKTGGTRYAAVYELRFKPARVQQYIRTLPAAAPVAASATGNVPAAVPVQAAVKPVIPVSANARDQIAAPANNAAGQVAAKKDPALIIPFYQPVTGGSVMIWSAENPLRDAIQKVGMPEATMKVPLGDLDDVQAFDESRGLMYRPEDLQKILTRYEAKDALFAVAAPERAGDGALRSIRVMMYHASTAHTDPEYIDSFVVSAKGDLAAPAAYIQAAAQIRAQAPGLLARPFKSETAQKDQEAKPQQETVKTELATQPAVFDQGAFYITARFSNLQEWQKMRAAIASIGAVRQVRVLSLKTQEARAEIVHAGKMDEITAELKARMIDAVPANAPAHAGVPVYALSFVSGAAVTAGDERAAAAAQNPVSVPRM